MTRLIAFVAVLALTISPAIARPRETYRISIPGPTPTDSLMGFDITVDNGQVSRLPKCLAGWAITLLNDPNWRATIEGHAIVGAASVPAHMLPWLLLVSSIPAADVLDVKDHIFAKGKLTFMRNGELFTVDEPRIDLVPFGRRHR